MRIDVLGVGFDDTTVESAASFALDRIAAGEKAYIVTPNPEIVWQCRSDEALRTAINNAGLVLPDGIGVILGAKILKTPLKGGRVPGIDFAAALFTKIAAISGSVFLFGAKPGVAEKAGENLVKMHPGLVIAGTADGYFSDDEALIEKINDSGANLLLVCLGAPKQEFWMAENSRRLNVPVCAGLGGSLDVFAGNTKRAPVFFQRFGIEWLYRIATNPHRLKRSLRLPLFVLAVIWARIK